LSTITSSISEMGWVPLFVDPAINRYLFLFSHNFPPLDQPLCLVGFHSSSTN